MKVFPVEGNRIRLDGGSMFGNAPKELWQRWIKADEHNRIELSCRSLLIQTDAKEWVLFEAGPGSCFEPALRDRYGIEGERNALLKSLAALNVYPEDIQYVILSHLHFDHVGGVLSAYEEGPLKLLFPNATYITSKTHFERALQPKLREKASFIPVLHERLQASNRLKLVEGSGVFSFEPRIRYELTDGHTVGLMVLTLELEKFPLVLATDIIAGIPWVHLPITMGYDRFPERVVEEKEKILGELLDRQGVLFLTHDPTHPFAKVFKDDKGRFYAEPLDLVLN